MTRPSRSSWRLPAALALGLGLATLSSGASAQTPPGAPAGAPAATAARASRLAFAHALPELDGTRLQVKVVEVVYAPGQSSPPHSHPCAVIGYIVEGAVRMQVNDEPEVTYKTGEFFYEAPNGHHRVSANASPTQPATLLAWFTCDKDTPLSTPVPAAGH